MWPGDVRKERAPRKSCAASNATSPGKSTNSSFTPQPAPDAGPLRTVRTAKHLTLQQAAYALHVWPTTLSRLERGLSHDNDFHKRYETWLNAQSPETEKTPYSGLA